MRQIDKPVQVVSAWDPAYLKPKPISFVWRGGRYRIIEVLDNWREAGRWWELRPDAEVWRVRCHDRGVYELAMIDTIPPEWRLMVVWD